jgi:voltage-gated potassium channel
MKQLRQTLKDLYLGDGKGSNRFRYALLAFDLIIIGFFLVTAMVEYRQWFRLVDYLIAPPLVLDFVARAMVAPSLRRYFRDPVTYADLVVIVPLFLPLSHEHLGFLRVLRAFRLFRSYRVQRELRRDLAVFKRNEEIIEAVINLALFVFVITAFVFVLQHGSNPYITNYLDALYFTVTTLTTTGFGDITLQGTSGRLLSVVIMVVGVGLFLRLVQAIFRSTKVTHRCPGCGLTRHEPDAVHCKACGEPLKVTGDGA